MQTLNEKYLSLISHALTSKTKQNLKCLYQAEQKYLDNKIISSSFDQIILEFDGISIYSDLASAHSVFNVFYDLYLGNEHRKRDSFNKAEGIILDIGANEGFYTIIVAKMFPKTKVFSFEPNPIAYDKLSKNIQLNGLNNVTAMSMAISDKTGLMNLDYVKEVTSISSKNIRGLNLPWLTEDRINTISVNSTTLDDFVMNNQIDSIDIVKVDVEGAEVDVVTGGVKTLSLTKKIVLEYHSQQIKNQLIELLLANNFKIILDDALSSTSTNSTGDIYFEKR